MTKQRYGYVHVRPAESRLVPLIEEVIRPLLETWEKESLQQKNSFVFLGGGEIKWTCRGSVAENNAWSDFTRCLIRALPNGNALVNGGTNGPPVKLKYRNTTMSIRAWLGMLFDVIEARTEVVGEIVTDDPKEIEKIVLVREWRIREWREEVIDA
jgi:hypothetical protein